MFWFSYLPITYLYKDKSGHFWPFRWDLCLEENTHSTFELTELADRTGPLGGLTPSRPLIYLDLARGGEYVPTPLPRPSRTAPAQSSSFWSYSSATKWWGLGAAECALEATNTTSATLLSASNTALYTAHRRPAHNVQIAFEWTFRIESFRSPSTKRLQFSAFFAVHTWGIWTLYLSILAFGSRVQDKALCEILRCFNSFHKYSALFSIMDKCK